MALLKVELTLNPCSFFQTGNNSVGCSDVINGT